MPRIRCLTSFATSTVCPSKGDVLNVSEALAADVVQAGFAEYVDGAPAPKSKKPASGSGDAGNIGAAGNEGAEGTTFEDLGINPKFAGYLRDAGLQTAADVAAKSDQELIDLPGLGKASVAAIRKALAG